MSIQQIREVRFGSAADPGAARRLAGPAHEQVQGRLTGQEQSFASMVHVGEAEVYMDVGIIGSGQIGSTLARKFAALGHRVSLANSRGPASLADIATDTGANAATVEQAAQAKDLVIIAIPQKSVRQLPPGLFKA